MLYQDLVRFSITTVLNQGQGEDVKQFIRESLLHFNKGKTNTPLYIFYGFLPSDYLKKFEKFLHLYESASLFGQSLSKRKKLNVNKNWDRKKASKLEFPLNLLKLHKNVSQHVRESLLDDLLEKRIDFSKYVNTLEICSDLVDVKKNVEIIAKTSVEELKSKSDLFYSHRNLFFIFQ